MAAIYQADVWCDDCLTSRVRHSTLVQTEALAMKTKKRRAPAFFFTKRAMDLDQRIKQAQGRLRETCKECGFKIRGPNHEQGIHHKERHPKLQKVET